MVCSVCSRLLIVVLSLNSVNFSRFSIKLRIFPTHLFPSNLCIMTLEILTLGILILFIPIHLSFIIHILSLFGTLLVQYDIVNSSSFDLFKLNFGNVLVLASVILCYLCCFAIEYCYRKNPVTVNEPCSYSLR